MMNLILLIVAVVVAYKVYENINKFGCKCENCGKNIKCDDEFCIHCGAKNNHQEAYMNNDKKQNSSFNYEAPKGEKVHYNYYEVVDDLDGVIVSLMAKVAEDNGVISDDESKYISERYLELARLTNKSTDVIEVYEEIFNREKDRRDNIIEIANKLKNLDDSAKVYVLKVLTELAGIDGENEILKEIKEAMKFETKATNSYYEILNSKPTDDWETIRKNYRELVKQYHYDKLASKNLPQDMLSYAEQRLKEINDAYNALKKLKEK